MAKSSPRHCLGPPLNGKVRPPHLVQFSGLLAFWPEIIGIGTVDILRPRVYVL